MENEALKKYILNKLQGQPNTPELIADEQAAGVPSNLDDILALGAVQNGAIPPQPITDPNTMTKDEIEQQIQLRRMKEMFDKRRLK